MSSTINTRLPRNKRDISELRGTPLARRLILGASVHPRDGRWRRKLRTAVASALGRAEDKAVERIAFPAMGAGYYGILPDLCARVMLETIKTYLEGETGIKELVICVLDTPQYEAFQARLTSLR